MRKKIVRYRLEINYYSQDYEYKCCEVSSPIYTKKDGLKEYMHAVQFEKCIDEKSAPARCHLWKYQWDDCGKCIPLTIAKNY